MTFKGIWSSFCDKTKEQGNKAWEGIKQVCSSSFSILKNTVIGFFTGIYNWLVDIITGVGKVVIALVSFVFSALGSAIFATLKLCLDKLIEWVTKW